MQEQHRGHTESRAEGTPPGSHLSSVRIGLVPNGATPLELAGCCPFVDRTYGRRLPRLRSRCGDPLEALTSVPREWDYVVENDRAGDSGHDGFAGFRRFYDAAAECFVPRVARGVAE